MPIDDPPKLSPSASDVVRAMMASIQRNPFSEVAARLKWSTTSQREQLLSAIRQRLEAELADWTPTASSSADVDLRGTSASMTKLGEGAPVSRFLRPPNFKELPMMAHTVPETPTLPQPQEAPIARDSAVEAPASMLVRSQPQRDTAQDLPSEQVQPAYTPSSPEPSTVDALIRIAPTPDASGGGTDPLPSNGSASLRQALRGAKLAAAAAATATGSSTAAPSFAAGAPSTANERDVYPVPFARPPATLPSRKTAADEIGDGNSDDDAEDGTGDGEMNNALKRSRGDDASRLDSDDEANNDDDDDDDTFDVFIPDAVRAPPRKEARVEFASKRQSHSAAAAHDALNAGDSAAPPADGTTPSTATGKHVSQMTKDEYMRQFKRAPRRGEIGITADDVNAATALGYVMSGSRNKSSEKYIDRIQRQLHEKQAAQLRLQFLQESDRRTEAAALQAFMDMLAPH